MKLPARIDWLGFARRLAPQATEADAELLLLETYREIYGI